MSAVKAVSLTKAYVNGQIKTLALNRVSLEIKKGEFVAIVGSSGSGKTTLLNMIGGLDRPTEGMVYINNISICDFDEEELCIFRRENIGFIFQNYNLLPVLNVYENIILPQRLDESKIDIEYVQEIAKALGIEEKLTQMPNALSGGQQRVAIARALCVKPAIVLADEPTGNLDSGTSREVIRIMKTAADTYSQTIAVVTHSEEIAAQADRVIRIEDGKIV